MDSRSNMGTSSTVAPNSTVDLAVFYGGKFQIVNAIFMYKGGSLHHRKQLKMDELNVEFCKDLGKQLCGSVDFDMWYRRYGMDLNSGRTLLLTGDDVVQLLRTVSKTRVVMLYITQPKAGVSCRITRSKGECNNVGSTVPSSTITDIKPNLRAHPILNSQSSKKAATKGGPSIFKAPRKKHSNTLNNDPPLSLTKNLSQKKSNLTSELLLPVRRSPRHQNSKKSDSAPSDHTPPLTVIPSRAKLPVKRNIKFEGNLKAGVEVEKSVGIGVEVSHGTGDEIVVEFEKSLEQGAEVDGGSKGKTLSEKVKGKGGRQKSVASKGKKPVASKGKDKGKVVVDKGKQKARFEVEEDEFTDSDLSEGSDPEFELDEYDVRVAEEEDIFIKPDCGEILKTVEETINLDKQKNKAVEESRKLLVGVDNLEINFIEEEPLYSDELRSLQGSDDEVDSYPSFNPLTDFSKPVKLKVGLKFPSVEVFRKALIAHSVSNGYDFWYSHNGRGRVTTQCRNRCNCPWNSKKSKFGKCTCNAPNKCKFRVHAVKMDNEETFQIRGLKLKHNCVMSNYNRKVTSEFLADKYIEFLRDNLDWKLKKFQTSVLRELGVHVSYMKCWSARARAKLIIYGNGSDQYAHVWNYARAILKYNPGSSAFVVCDSIERPPPIFKRMYICLAACKEGFNRGCRPILGVDGCHLKGVYPGICLVAVGLDGNNNIYPIAWAVVEVENRDSWTWFLELLSSDLGKVDGEGLTIMSDRQKGLIDALNRVVPKAHVRYCARHIWANFKINFSGQLFKETFWNAARAATKADFDIEMANMKSLSTAAWEYLNAIPPRHWSRHAFDTNCKSNLLLNNLCEVFNNVLKEARDKPILTHMEWMRRYVMERICHKRQGGMAYEERLMPYATKYNTWAQEESRLCKWSRSDMGIYEVIYRGEQCVVDLNLRTCTCFHWDLTGLPCPHAMFCLLLERKDPVHYVHEAYSKAKYQLTYEPAVLPMPGVKHWEKTGLPEPLPPPMRTMPGRPKSKKRRKEAGEDAEQKVKRVKKANKCGNCGGLGHSRRTCKNPAAPPLMTKAPGGRPLSRSQWAKEGRQKRAAAAAASAATTQARPSNRAAVSSQAGTSNRPPSAARTNNSHGNYSFTELLSQASNNLL